MSLNKNIMKPNLLKFLIIFKAFQHVNEVDQSDPEFSSVVAPTVTFSKVSALLAMLLSSIALIGATYCLNKSKNHKN